MSPKDRLLKLADFLEHSVPQARFNMTFFADGDLAHDCGTAGCAAGWATQIPEFQAEGFHLEMHQFTWPTRIEPVIVGPGHNPYSNDVWPILMSFFGLETI